MTINPQNHSDLAKPPITPPTHERRHNAQNWMPKRRQHPWNRPLWHRLERKKRKKSRNVSPPIGGQVHLLSVPLGTTSWITRAAIAVKRRSSGIAPHLGFCG